MDSDTFSQYAQNLAEQARDLWLRWWLLRWVSLNLLAWFVGLLGFALLVAWFGLVGVPIGLLLLGLLIGVAQRYAQVMALSRQWLWWSMGGVVLGALSLFLLVPIWLIHQQAGLLLMGALFGGVLGGLQAMVVQTRGLSAALAWAFANVIAGLMCAPLTFGLLGMLPIVCMPGFLLFSLITGWAIGWVRRQPLEKSP
ncbi:hypothetical protein G4Y79_08480 [Phototrophicus methaneseepsis]|uniref:Uncharacterized protein n=1 Tax=Phototrophicus methaneseepsis TaxID=2710758 RepID=A0A7S8ECD7_9CHLR|nr:hypothetical protein [Phototrophicus methaneseepsis]QPC84397.1 hypothetical protein G4Y79_08480 [Phototrophicus methaneseepsis]